MFAAQMSFAAQDAQLTAFLSGYMSSSAASNAVIIYNGVIGSNSYLLVQANGTTVVVNTTQKYNFTNSNETIYKFIDPYEVSINYPSANTIANLANGINPYIDATSSQGSGSLADCLQITGANQYTCSPGAANVTTCMQNTCDRITACGNQRNKASLLSSFGTPSIVTASIQNLSIWNAGMQSSFTKYLSASASINQTSIDNELSIMSSAIANITTYSGEMSTSALLLPLPGSTSGCTAPVGWPCDAIGYCPYNTTLGFNFTLLSHLQSQITALESLPLNFSSINALAISYENNAQALEAPVVYKEKMAEFDQSLSSTFNSYAALYANMSFLSSHYSNSLLLTSLKNLSDAYNTVILNGINQNITTANRSLSSSVSNALKQYAMIAPSFDKLYGMAFNNTVMITINELDYNGDVPAGTLSLAAQQAAINEQLQSKLNSSQLSALLPAVQQINSQAKALSQPFSLDALAKWAYGGIASAMLSGSSQTIAQKEASAPVYAALLDLVVALAIVALVYEGTYARLKKKGKIHLSHTVTRVWTIIFIVLLVIALADAYSVYAYAQKANAFLPISGFIGALQSSNTVFIGLSQPNTLLSQCAASVSSTLSSMGKTSYIVPISNFTCSYPGSNSITGQACYSKMAATAPVMVLSNGNSSIVYSGMYGTVLYANGTSAYGPSCMLNSIIKVS
jgi:hypothetical protein